MLRIIFTTTNKGKFEHVLPIAQQQGIDLLSAEEAGIIVPTEETGATFDENAQLKLSAALQQMSDLSWVITDDSGVEIDALGGEPGVHTRRWKGREMTDQEIVDYTLERMKMFPYAKRDASFVSVIALGKERKIYTTVTDRIRGKILMQPDTSATIEGIPFRQLFYDPEHDRMLGDIQDQTPGSEDLSHLQKSFLKAISYIKDIESIEGA